MTNKLLKRIDRVNNHLANHAKSLAELKTKVTVQQQLHGAFNETIQQIPEALAQLTNLKKDMYTIKQALNTRAPAAAPAPDQNASNAGAQKRNRDDTATVIEPTSEPPLKRPCPDTTSRKAILNTMAKEQTKRKNKKW